MRTKDLADRCRATARQIDYWASLGLIPGQPRDPGSGSWRQWDEDQASFVVAMAALVDQGVAPGRAARLAGPLSLGQSVRLGRYILSPPLAGTY